jgi:hypothetical protein
MRYNGWAMLLAVGALLLAACGCAQDEAAPEPKMEALVIADGESGEGWNSAEATMEPSEKYARRGQALNFHIEVDHTAGEPNYPIGWPRTYHPIPEDQRDWSQYDFLEFWLYADTSREKLPGTPLGLILRCPDRPNSWDRTLSEATKGEWVHYRIPLADIPNIHDCAAIQFFISESNYKHGDVVDFYIDEIALLRYAEPTIVSLQPLQGLLYRDEGAMRIEVDVSGIAEGETAELSCRLKQGQEMLGGRVTAVQPGRQTFLLEVDLSRLKPGEGVLEAKMMEADLVTRRPIRVVSSPWEG